MDKELTAARTTTKAARGCKNPEQCSATTNVTEDVECGWGVLDYNGFWEHDCPPCTEALRMMLYISRF